jgi:hypothetical protein
MELRVKEAEVSNRRSLVMAGLTTSALEVHAEHQSRLMPFEIDEVEVAA